MAPCVPGLSAGMVLILQDKNALIFQVEGFQLPVPSQYQEMTENANLDKSVV